MSSAGRQGLGSELQAGLAALPSASSRERKDFFPGQAEPVSYLQSKTYLAVVLSQARVNPHSMHNGHGVVLQRQAEEGGVVEFYVHRLGHRWLSFSVVGVDPGQAGPLRGGRNLLSVRGFSACLGLTGLLSAGAVLRLLQAASHPRSPLVKVEVYSAMVLLILALAVALGSLFVYGLWLERQERWLQELATSEPGLNPSADE